MLSRVFIGSVYNLTRNTNANGERVNGVLDDTAVCKGQQCVACARTALVQPLRLLGGESGPGHGGDRASIHDPRLPLSSPTCGPPENHRWPTRLG